MVDITEFWVYMHTSHELASAIAFLKIKLITEFSFDPERCVLYMVICGLRRWYEFVL